MCELTICVRSVRTAQVKMIDESVFGMNLTSRLISVLQLFSDSMNRFFLSLSKIHSVIQNSFVRSKIYNFVCKLSAVFVWDHEIIIYISLRSFFTFCIIAACGFSLPIIVREVFLLEKQVGREIE